MTKRAYKMRFYPTEEMQAQLAIEFGHGRFVYNWGLDMRNKAYSRRGKSLGTTKISKILTQLKKTSKYAWLNQASATCLVQKLRDMDTAFANFFNPKLEAKYPKFKKKSHWAKVRYQDVVFDKDKLVIPKLGNVHNCVRWSHRPPGTPKMATISRVASGKYYITFVVDELILPKPKTKFSVGIDLGITDVVATSDSWMSGAVKFTNKYANQLRRAQKKLSRMKKGSNRWHKQRIRVARIHEKIVHSRMDFTHKLTSQLVSLYDFIAAESLRVKNMMKNHNLAKAIADASWGELARQLKYKCEWYGKTFYQVDTWFPSSQLCSSCHGKKKMPLENRTYKCGECGMKLDRDINAAINILNEARRVLSGTGGEHAGTRHVEGSSATCADYQHKQEHPMKREDELNFSDEHGFAV